jgi:signal transduction histidine kinase
MNDLTAFFSDHIIYIYFFYGLAFFSLGLTLHSARSHDSTFRFAGAIGLLALFGYLHGIHEWVEMVGEINRRSGGQMAVSFEAGRLLLLILSFAALIAFGARLLAPPEAGFWRRYAIVGLLLALWGAAVAALALARSYTGYELIAAADVMARYLLAIPGSLLAAWMLMAQQRTFREQQLSRFGRNLVWCALALILYGGVSQMFVRPADFLPANLLNSQSFLAWFGIPVQLFRAVLAIIITVYMVRALRVFDVENRRRLDEASRVRFTAQADALAAERRNTEAVETLNRELRATTRELALVIEIANLLAMPLTLDERLCRVLTRIVENLRSTDAGLIMLPNPENDVIEVAVHTGFVNIDNAAAGGSRFNETRELAERSVAECQALCRHADGQVLAMEAEFALLEKLCRAYASPTLYIALPLLADDIVIGSVALARARETEQTLSVEELQLLTGIAHQLGLSIHNAQLLQQAKTREERLAELLRAVVTAQENERQRIARELHDATGQTLTAIALGLRGIQTMSAASGDFPARQVVELERFATTAIGELHQIIADLRPPQLDDLGLPATLRWYVQEFGNRHGLTAKFESDGQLQALPAEYETVLFRIAQEALTNVAKHASASAVSVTLGYGPTHVALIVQDDGRGFPTTEFQAGIPPDGQAGWGLLGIQERAVLLGGRSMVDSVAERGTTVRVEIPRPALPGQQAESDAGSIATIQSEVVA